MKTSTKLLLTILVLVVYTLHQDFWNWTKAEPLVFGFLPIGLAVTMAGLVQSRTCVLTAERTH